MITTQTTTARQGRKESDMDMREVKLIARLYAHILRVDDMIGMDNYQALTSRTGLVHHNVRLWLDDMFGARVLLASWADDVDGVHAISMPV